MLNNIFSKFSEYALLRDGEHPFSNKYSATAETLLTEFTTNEEIVTSSVEATGSVIRHCPKYERFYQKKYAETKNTSINEHSR